jgi:hypothetical protein
MRNVIAIAVGVLCLAGAANAQGPAPTFKTVSSTDKEKGHIFIVQTTMRAVPVQKVVEVVKDGIKQLATLTEYVPVYEQITIAIDATKSRVITPDGKQLPIDEVWKRLKAKSVIVVSADGKTPDADYLRVLRPETLILIPAQVGPPMPLIAPKPEPIDPPKKMP